jgi:hypothetical protein
MDTVYSPHIRKERINMYLLCTVLLIIVWTMYAFQGYRNFGVYYLLTCTLFNINVCDVAQFYTVKLKILIELYLTCTSGRYG